MSKATVAAVLEGVWREPMLTNLPEGTSFDHWVRDDEITAVLASYVWPGPGIHTGTNFEADTAKLTNRSALLQQIDHKLRQLHDAHKGATYFGPLGPLLTTLTLPG